MCVCACVCVCNKCLIRFNSLLNFSCLTLMPSFLAVLLPPQLYAASSSAQALHRLIIYPSSYIPIDNVCRPALDPLHGTSSAIDAPYNISVRCRIRASFYRGTHRSRLLEITIDSGILSPTNPHNSEYSQFRFKIISADNLFCAAEVSALGITSAG